MQNINQRRGTGDEGRGKTVSELRVTLIQSVLLWGNIEGNLRHFEEVILNFKNSTDLIVLPEMFSTGFSMRTELAEEMNGNAVNWMQRMAQAANAVITGSLMIRDDGKFFNRLMWMRPDGTHEYYDKRHLFSLGEEHKHFSAGKKRITVSLNGWTVCPLVCYDLRFPVWCRNLKQSAVGGRLSADMSQYDVLIFVANWPERRNFAWKHLLQARAIENQAYVIGVNRMGNDGNGIYHSGDSALIDPIGEVMFTQADTPFAKTFTLSKERIEYVRSKMPFLEDGDEFKI